MYLSLYKMKSWLKYFVLILCLKFIEGSQPFRCDYEYSSEAKGWFKHFVIPATAFEARARCALEGAVLASPTTPEIKDEMINIINSTATEQLSEIFTGTHSYYSTGAFYTIEGTPLSKIPHTWAPGEPDNKNNRERCLTLNNHGDLADLFCRATRPFICYRSESNEVKLNECGTVDPEYRFDKRTNKCYKFHTAARNYSRAFLVCAAEGGHLAIINSDAEAGVLSDLFSKYPTTILMAFYTNIIFIGCYDWNGLGDWRTIHGQRLAEAGYSKFLPGRPIAEPNKYISDNYQCCAMFRSGELTDMNCEKEVVFICEKSPKYDAACTFSDEESL